MSKLTADQYTFFCPHLANDVLELHLTKEMAELLYKHLEYKVKTLVEPYTTFPIYIQLTGTMARKEQV